MAVQLVDSLGRTFDINDNRVTIGSDKTSGLPLPELAASGTTMELVQEGMQWQLLPIATTSNIMLNGVPSNGPLYLRHNDVIQIDNFSLRFLDWDHAPAGAVPAQPVYQTGPVNYPGQQFQMRGMLPAPSKDRTAAALLAILLGGIGAHHFYLGNIILGIVYLLFSWTFIPMIVGIIEGIVMLTTSDENWLQKYPPR